MATQERIISIGTGRRSDRRVRRKRQPADGRAAQRRLQQFVGEVTGQILAAPADAVDHGILQGLRALGLFAEVPHSWLAIVGDNGEDKPRFREWCEIGAMPLNDRLRYVEADAAPWFTEQFLQLSPLSLRLRTDLPAHATQERALMEKLGIHAIAAVPSTAGGPLVVVGLAAELPRVWEQDVMTALALLGSAVANILERRRTDRRLRNALAERQAIFHSVSDCFFRLSADGTINDYELGRCNDLHLQPEQFLGKTMQAVLPAEAGELFKTAWTELQRERRPARFEYLQPATAGAAQLFEVQLVPLIDGRAIVLLRRLAPQISTSRPSS